MKVIQKIRGMARYDIATAFDQKGVCDYNRIHHDVMIGGHPRDIWWYRHKGANHICINATRAPYDIVFILLERGDLFTIERGKQLLETGISPEPAYYPSAYQASDFE